MQRLEELAEKEPERVHIIKKARVTSLNKEGNKITGVSYEFGGEPTSIDGPVVLATGGYEGTISRLLKIAKELGLRGSYSGIGPRLLMVGGMGAGQFAIYGSIKKVSVLSPINADVR